jgi:hypothetical protein
MINPYVPLAVAMAAHRARIEQEQREEEAMSSYGDGDLAEDWEFKILRSPWAQFRNPDTLRAILAEEKQGGWILAEKFDDSRIRLKRRRSTKITVADFASGYDPYRTTLNAVPPSAMFAILIALAAVPAGVLLWLLFFVHP